jgi:ubiquinone/menaquinone biosynthesis C-methylase UbiE
LQPEPDETRDEKDRVADVFGRVAGTFDRTGPAFFSVFGERLVRLAGIRAGQTVLDVACGRGASALPAARLTGRTGRVVAVDLAQSMVDELSREATGQGLARLDTAVMDAEVLLLPDAVFDRVLGGFFLFFLPDPGRALGEMRRVLKPDGRLAVSTWDKRDDGWGWLDDLTDSYLPAPDAELARRRRERDRTGDPAGMRELLREAGFASVEIVEESEEFTYSGEDEGWASLWTRGRRRAMERIGATLGTTGLAAFEKEARGQLRARGLAGPDGVRRSVSVLYSLAVR